MKFISVLLIFLFIVFPIAAEQVFPAWFLFPAKFPDIIVGFSCADTDPIDDATIMNCLYKDCIVSGTVYAYNDFDQRHNDYYYDYSAKCLKETKPRLKKIDQFITNIILSEYIGAFTLDSIRAIDFASVSMDSLSQPKWINKTIWQDTDYYYGVGMYSLKMNFNDAWKTAEEKAIFEIMNAISVDFVSVKIQNEHSDSPLEEISAVSVNYRISDIQVVERWPDLKNLQAYCLIRIPTNKIIPLKPKSTNEN